MTALAVPRAVAPRVPEPPVRTGPTVSRGLLILILLGLGAVLAVGGFGLRGSSHVAPQGLIGGGVALMVVAPFARGSLDVLVVLSPFEFYALAPVGGLLTVGSSDVVLPIIVLVLVIVGVFGPLRPSGLPRLPGAGVLLLVSLVLSVTSTVMWTVLSPSFLLTQAVSDFAKLAIGVVYFVVVFLLVRRGGRAAAVRAFQLWAWTATALSLGSLSGGTGALTLIPSDGYRSLGYFEDANLYSGYLLVSLSVVLFLATIERSRFLVVQLLAIVGGVVTTGSRGGLGSLVVLVLFAVVIINSARLRALLLAMTALGGVLFAYLYAHRDDGISVLGIDRLFSASQKVDQDPRIALWHRAIEKWLDSPLYGIGLGQFERFSADVFRTSKTSGLGYVTHNTFLFFLVSFGVIGLVLFVAMLGWLVLMLYRSPRLSRISKHALTSGVVVLMSQMMTLNLQNLRYVWIYFGLVLGVAMLGPDPAHPDPAPRARASR